MEEKGLIEDRVALAVAMVGLSVGTTVSNIVVVEPVYSHVTSGLLY